MTHPILWSFRRCPYAIRARLAIASANIQVELREVVLRDKPRAFLDASPSATVPCLEAGSTVLDESYDIMLWALRQNDPEGWLDVDEEAHDLIAQSDGPFKTALDRYKYSVRYEGVDALAERERAMAFVELLEERLSQTRFLAGEGPTIADMAILPFVRQFAHVDLDWFNGAPVPRVNAWLDDFKTSDRFAAVMAKYPQWRPGEAGQAFP